VTDAPLDPIAVTVPTALKLSGLGRTKLYELIALKQIRSGRVGKRRLINYESLKAFLTSRETTERQSNADPPNV
jgi:excisionase family DNA binding protein